MRNIAKNIKNLFKLNLTWIHLHCNIYIYVWNFAANLFQKEKFGL